MTESHPIEDPAPKADGKVRTTHVRQDEDGNEVRTLAAVHDTHAEALAWIGYACKLKNRDPSEYQIDPPPPPPPSASEPDDVAAAQ